MARINKEREGELQSFIQSHMSVNDHGQLVWTRDWRMHAKIPIISTPVGKVFTTNGFEYCIANFRDYSLGNDRNSTCIMSNRCAWLLHTGRFPEGTVVHLDGNILNFSKDNLGEYNPRVNHAISHLQNNINNQKFTIEFNGRYHCTTMWDDPTDMSSEYSVRKFDSYDNALRARIAAAEKRIETLRDSIKMCK